MYFVEYRDEIIFKIIRLGVNAVIALKEPKRQQGCKIKKSSVSLFHTRLFTFRLLKYQL